MTAADVGLKTLVKMIRERGDEPCEETRELQRPDQPAPVAAFLAAAAEHGMYIDLAGSAGGFELVTPETLEDHNDADHISSELQAHNVQPEDVLVLGSTGGGEVSLLLGWTEATHGFFRWDMDEATLTADGSFSAFLLALRDHLVEEREAEPSELVGTDLHQLLVATGAWGELE